MLGSFLSGLLIYAVAYVYPAYECYKTVELNKPEIEKLRFWCQYWILIAFLAVVENFADFFISWLPLYCEAKLVLYVFLWYPNLRGASYFYDTFFRPCISKYETDIDRYLLELKTRAGDIMLMCLHKASNYGRSSIFEMIKNVTFMMQTPFQTQSPPQQPQKSKQSQPRKKPQEEPLAQQEPRSPPPPAPPTPHPANRPQERKPTQHSRNAAGSSNRRSSADIQEKGPAATTQNAGENLLQEARAKLASKSPNKARESIPEGQEPRQTAD